MVPTVNPKFLAAISSSSTFRTFSQSQVQSADPAQMVTHGRCSSVRQKFWI
jgi:hypothetical protein